jgi:hypothetical protein
LLFGGLVASTHRKKTLSRLFIIRAADSRKILENLGKSLPAPRAQRPSRPAKNLEPPSHQVPKQKTGIAPLTRAATDFTDARRFFPFILNSAIGIAAKMCKGHKIQDGEQVLLSKTLQLPGERKLPL